MTSVMTECIIKIYNMSRIIQPLLSSPIVNLAENKNPHSKSEGLCGYSGLRISIIEQAYYIFVVIFSLKEKVET
jgi:hypothetical protein